MNSEQVKVFYLWFVSELRSWKCFSVLPESQQPTQFFVPRDERGRFVEHELIHLDFNRLHAHSDSMNREIHRARAQQHPLLSVTGGPPSHTAHFFFFFYSSSSDSGVHIAPLVTSSPFFFHNVYGFSSVVVSPLFLQVRSELQPVQEQRRGVQVKVHGCNLSVHCCRTASHRHLASIEGTASHY